MRFTAAVFATVVFSSTSVLACEISPQSKLKLDSKDQSVLSLLGKAINAKDLLNGGPSATIFTAPPSVLTLNESDAKTLSRALIVLRKSTACYADRVTMERILEDNTAGIRFLKQIEGCLADACVDNK